MNIAKIQKWCEDNLMECEQSGLFDELWLINGEHFLYVSEKSGKIFDKDFNFVLNEIEAGIMEDDGAGFNPPIKHFFFDFAGKYFYCPTDSIELKPLKYIGKAKQVITVEEVDYTPLGIHGKYEICNGTRDYDEWLTKAKFLGYKSVGIAEKNTLGGIIPFKKACKEAKIKGILGETISIRVGNSSYDCKVYAYSEKGWKNLLHINAKINSTPSKFILEEEITKDNSGKGCVFIFGNNYPLTSEKIKYYKTRFDAVFYQLDTVRWQSERTDVQYVNNIKNYLFNFTDELDPIIINDSYYLDSDEAHSKKLLNKIGSVEHQNDSIDQHFKTLDEVFNIWTALFPPSGEEIGFGILQKALENTKIIADSSDFEIITGKFHLPEFGFARYGATSSLALFNMLIEQGAEKKGVNNNQAYIDRIEKEKGLIIKGGFVDYFLILWDMINWCDSNKILVGPGRGSAVGSLVSYLLGITKLDPMKYNLLFERFLNEGRLKSLPDIDTDFEANRREEVVKYLEETYGKYNVTSVGTYKNFLINQAIKDLGKLKGLDFKTLNIITSSLKFKEGKGGDFEEIFFAAQKDGHFRDFIQNNTELIHTVYYLLKTPKAVSIHPCATIILPQYPNESILDYIPIRIEDGNLVSEWEGPALEAAGFLKEDVLSLNQLDKISYCINLIKQNSKDNPEIDIYNIPLDDPKVMEYFKKGHNGDVFQFGSDGLTSYCREVQPDTLDELTTMVALFRPGPISSGAHFDYVKFKRGLQAPKFDFGLKEVTKNTYGLYIFQEQVMQAAQVLGGFSSEQTDDVRRAMGKKKEEVIKPYRDKFIDGAIKNGCSKEEAEKIWHKLEVFSGYGFNKSHAAAYSYLGYVTQWLKVYYPLQFWTATFQKLNDDEDKDISLIKYLSEIKVTDDWIQVKPADINFSGQEIVTNYETGEIFWSLDRIKYLGPVALQAILKERVRGGQYFSIEDFVSRVPKADVNKRTVTNLILTGAFDKIEGIKGEHERARLLSKYHNFIELEGTEKKYLNYSRWWWVLKQKELSGLGYINYNDLIISHFDRLNHKKVLLGQDLQEIEVIDKNVAFAGVVKTMRIKDSKNGKWCMLEIDSNNNLCYVNVWAGSWKRFAEDLKGSEGNLIVFDAVVRKDETYKKCNTLHMYDNCNMIVLKPEKLETPKAVSVSVKKGDMVELKDGRTGLITKYPSNTEITVIIAGCSHIVTKADIKGLTTLETIQTKLDLK